MEHPQFKINKRAEDMMPKPFIITDAIIIKKRIDIDSLYVIENDTIN
jgi:hypothetical protein